MMSMRTSLQLTPTIRPCKGVKCYSDESDLIIKWNSYYKNRNESLNTKDFLEDIEQLMAEYSVVFLNDINTSDLKYPFDFTTLEKYFSKWGPPYRTKGNSERIIDIMFFAVNTFVLLSLFSEESPELTKMFISEFQRSLILHKKEGYMKTDNLTKDAKHWTFYPIPAYKTLSNKKAIWIPEIKPVKGNYFIQIPVPKDSILNDYNELTYFIREKTVNCFIQYVCRQNLKIGAMYSDESHSRIELQLNVENHFLFFLMTKIPELNKLKERYCQCGCGLPLSKNVNRNTQFIKGHNIKLKNDKPEVRLKGLIRVWSSRKQISDTQRQVMYSIIDEMIVSGCEEVEIREKLCSFKKDGE